MTCMETDFKLRHVGEPGDIELMQRWRAERGLAPVPVYVLPASGVVVSDDDGPVAMGWLHMSNSVGVCWVESLTVKRGLGLKKADAAAGAVLLGLEIMAAEHDYGLMIAHCEHRLAMAAQRHGFRRGGDRLTCIMKEVERHG